jgi:Domain of unknown function (DUF5063)
VQASDSRLTGHPSAAAYRDAARLYCALMEGYRRHSRASFIKHLEPSLAFLYYAGSPLPDVTPATATADLNKQSAANGDLFGEQFGQLRAFLGDYDTYREVLDPLDPNDEPVQVHLAGDLVEIYEDSLHNLKLLDLPEVAPDDVLWEWRFSFSHHWSRHVVSALRVVNALVHSCYAGEVDD